jgi:hypothetical protein
MTARRSEEDFNLPLLESDADLEHGMGLNAGYESLPEGSHHSHTSEGPAWMSEQHGPLQDSPTPLHFGLNEGSERTGYGKLGRSVKRSTASARARYVILHQLFLQDYYYSLHAFHGPDFLLNFNKTFSFLQAAPVDMLGRGRQAHGDPCRQASCHRQDRPSHSNS